MWERTYDIIDNLIPPTSETDRELSDSLLRLESISACTIVRDTNSCKWLSKTPRPLHPVIWKAYLRDEYYNYKGRCLKLEESGLSDLPELLYHWPDEEFILKEIMPSFPAKSSWFSLLWHEYDDEDTPYNENQNYLSFFYSTVTKAIFESFLKNKSKVISNTFKNCKSEDICDGSGSLLPLREQMTWQESTHLLAFRIKINRILGPASPIRDTHNHECKIRKLDISGLLPDGSDNFSLNQFSELSRQVTTRYGAGRSMSQNVKYENLFGENFDNIEVILNANLSLEANHNESAANKKKKKKNSKSNAVIILNAVIRSNAVIRCGQTECWGSDLSKISSQVIGKSINKETKSIKVVGMSETEILNLINIFGTTTEQINILSLGVIGGLSENSSRMPLNFLQYLKNLEHLSITLTDLHGKIGPLLHLEKGLRYLFLRECKLNNSDLDVLLRSNHKSTLLELNLANNKFDEDATNLIKLCQELPKVITLNLDKCLLEKLQDGDLQILCDSLSSLPNLVHLVLSDNEFSTDILKSHLTSLSSSPSLRLLELQMPIMEISVRRGSVKNKYAVINKLSALINTTMNKDRGQLLYVDFGDYLKCEDYRVRTLDPNYY